MKNGMDLAIGDRDGQHDAIEILRELVESLDDLDTGANHYDSTGSSCMTVRALNRYVPARKSAREFLSAIAQARLNV